MQEHQRNDSRHKQRSSLVLMLSTLLSRVLGIVRVRLVSVLFGAGPAADVINFTFNIPNNFRKLLAEGALSSAFIPVLSHTIRLDETDKPKQGHAQKLTAAILGFQTLFLAPLAAAVFLFPSSIIRFLSDFSDPYQIELSVYLLRYFTLYLAAVSYIAVIQAVLHCRSSFAVPALSPLAYSIVVIMTLILLTPSVGPEAMGIGVLAGGILQLIIVLLPFYRHGYRLRLCLPKKNPLTAQFFRSFLPVFSIALISVIAQQISFYLASRLPEGGVTALANALVFWQMPYGVFSVSIITVFFPAMSRSFQSRDTLQLKETFRKGSEYILVFLIPSALILFLLAEEIVFTLLQRGEFSPEDALRTAETLKAFMPSLIWAGLFHYSQRLLFALHRFSLAVRTVLIYAAVDIGITVVCIIAGLDTISLGIGSTAGYLAAYLIQMHMIRRLLRTMDAGNKGSVGVLKFLLRVTAANLPIALLLILYTISPLRWYTLGSTLKSLLLLVLFGAAMTAGVAALYRIFAIDFMLRKRNRESV